MVLMAKATSLLLKILYVDWAPLFSDEKARARCWMRRGRGFISRQRGDLEWKDYKLGKICCFSIILCVFVPSWHYRVDAGLMQVLARSREQLCNHRDLVLRQLSQLGFRVNWEKSKLSHVQRITFLCVELDLVNMMACLMDERTQSVLNCLSSTRGRNVVPLKQFQRLLGHMASAAAVTPLRLLHMRSLQHWLHSWVPRWAWRRGTLQVNIS